jgi:RND family efflux transporter MFP subunit
MRIMGFYTVFAFALSVALASAGCNRGQDRAELPPATGPEAPPLTDLPSLALDPQTDNTATASSTQETTGTTFPRAHAQVAPNMSGIIASIAVEEGDKVKKGDLLFRLRGQDFALHVKQAEAALKSAKVRLDAVRVEYERTQRLLEKNAVNQAAWDRVSAEYQGAQVGVEQANVAVSMAKKSLADATVRSPIDGVITAKLKSEGEMATMMPPSPVVVIEDHSVLELRFRLAERYLGDVAVGQMVNARFTAVPATRQAAILRISPSVDSTTRTFEVVAQIPNAEGQLKSGMLAQVELGAGSKDAKDVKDAKDAKEAAHADR